MYKKSKLRRQFINVDTSVFFPNAKYYYKMNVFTNLLGPIAPLIHYFPGEENQYQRHNTNAVDSKTSANNSQQYADFLSNLSVDEINAIIRKYVTFDDSSDTTGTKLVRSFLILLSVPCVVMFFILVTQHVSVFLKIFIGFLTIMHVIVITYYLHETQNGNSNIQSKYTHTSKDFISKALTN